MQYRVVRMGNGETPVPQSMSEEKPIQKESSPEETSPGIGKKLGYWLSQGATWPLEFAESFAPHGSSAFSKIAEGTEQGKSIGQYRQELTGLAPEDAEPSGLLERFAQKGLTQGPVSAALGGLPSLATSLLSAIPAAGLGELGAPESVQDIAQLATGVLGPMALGKAAEKYGQNVPEFLKKPVEKAKNLQWFTGKQTELYDQAKAAIPEGERFVAKPVDDAISKVKEMLLTEVDKKKSTSVNNVIKKIKSNLVPFFENPRETTNRLDPKKALALRKSINSSISESPKLKEWTIPLRDGINDFFAEYSATNPKFFSALNNADKITSAKHMHSYVEDGIDLLLPKAKIPQVNEWVGGLLKRTLGIVPAQTEKILRRVLFNKPARELYFDVVKSVAENNPALFAKNLSSLFQYEQDNNLLPAEMKKKEEGSTPYRVVSIGGMK